MSIPTFAEALAYAEKRQVVLPPEFYDPKNKDRHGELMTISHLAMLSQIEAATDDLKKALANGETLEDWKKRIARDGLPELKPDHLETVFRNYMQTAYNGGRWQQFERNKKTVPYLMYSAINDERTTTICRSRNGIIRPVDDPFWSAGNCPPLHHRCFLPRTMVRGDFEIGLKSWYSGPAVEIVTDFGFRLSVTANHPILTRHGWVGADSVHQGDDLLCNREWDNSAIIGVMDNQNPPSSVEDVFHALARDAFGIVKMTAFDFQSDTKFRKGDVDVVGAKCVLMNGFQPNVNQCVQNGYFVRATAFIGVALASISRTASHIMRSVFHEDADHVGWTGVKFFRKRVAAFVNVLIGFHNRSFQSIITMCGSFPCFAALPFNSTGRFFNLLPFLQFSLASPAHGDAISCQKPLHSSQTYIQRFSDLFGAIARNVSGYNYIRMVWRPLPSRNRPFPPVFKRFLIGHSSDPVIAQQPTKQTVANAELFKRLAHGSAGLILPDKVKSVRYFTFSGHVYDFQTANGLILANGIITHNCRSTLISLTKSEADSRSQGNNGLNKSAPSEPAAGGWGRKPILEKQAENLAAVVADKLKSYPKNLLKIIGDLFKNGWSKMGGFLKKILPGV